MPSTVVHLALAGLIAAALLDEFDARALVIVLVAAGLPDLDTFIGIAFPGTHRALLHSVVVPALAAGLIAYDTRRPASVLRTRGPRTVRLAWVAVFAYLFAGVAPDLFTNGVNLFYPLHDRFYALSGDVYLSNQRGLVETVLREPVRGTTATTHYYTGVDLVRGPDPPGAERIFPIVNGGFQLLLVLLSGTIVSFRLWFSQSR